MGERVQVYRTRSSRFAVGPSADDAASSTEPADPRDYDVDHYARVLRDTYAARLARALTPTDYAAVFADPDQFSLFAPSTAAMRPRLATRFGAGSRSWVEHWVNAMCRVPRSVCPC